MRAADAAAIIIENQNGEVLIQLRENSPSVTFANHWTLPGGKIEAGETPLQGAVRELKEETGLDTPLALWRHYERIGGNDLCIQQYVFTGRTQRSVDEMILGEGQALRFITAGDIPSLAMAYEFDVLLAEFFSTRGT